MQHARRNNNEEFKKKVYEMVPQGVVTAGEASTPRVSPLSYQKKADRSLRICIDPMDLNKGIIHENYKEPTLEKITHHFKGKRPLVN